ncbi:MAG: chemotaxis protein CheB [Prolixibacteraceae bacterium]
MNIKKQKPRESDVKKTGKNEFPIVGIGASAGGLEALEQFFSNMPGNNGMAFVVIQHLDPTHVGILPELLQRSTSMLVAQATDRLRVKPNCVYVIPPNKNISILNGVLHLFEPVESRGLRLPIDFFFRSLALEKQNQSIGIVLSGMGSDGSSGLMAIKEKHGIAIVQEPDTAKFDGMPTSAMEAIVPDILAPANEMAAKLIAFSRYQPTALSDQDFEKKYKGNLEKIIILLREHTGHDFSMYKKTTLFRRIERRKGVHQIAKIQSYVRFLQENPIEIELLFKELLIGVTNFFRDTNVWEKLKNEVLPPIIGALPEGYCFRAWIPACSTGEEAYSMAIVLKEVYENVENRNRLSFQLFATDLDQDAIEKARTGVFSSNIESYVSKERLQRFFTAENNTYRISSSIREMIVFAPQNAIKDPPFTKLNLLSCRNMLIYMEPTLQKKLLTLFNYSLTPGGILVLGTAETIGNLMDGFSEIDSKLKIYQHAAPVSSSEQSNFPSSFYRPATVTNHHKMPIKTVENIQSLADTILLQRFAPASILVNEKGDIVYITGRTGNYLEPAAGKANWNVFAMAREGLRHELPGAFRKVLQNFDPFMLRQIKIGTNGGSKYVDVTMQRIETPSAIKGMIFIVFNDVEPTVEASSPDKSVAKTISNSRQQELELELQHTIEELKSTREEMQTSQEELKSTNEELQSTNEELQSTNEELTTSKEEMQSMNEELQTVNNELQCKINDLLQTNSDMKNLLNSTEIATLFLNKDLNIRRFTDKVIQIFKLRDSDIGRPFTDLVSDLIYPEIENDARQVLKTLSSIESAIATKDGRWYSVRIMPYRTYDDRIDGLVITFTDMTTTKKLESQLKTANELLKNKN